METKAAARWPRIVGYPFFFVVCFVFFFHLTLPYGVMQERLVEAARQSGHALTVASLGPALGFGITAKRLAFAAPAPTGPAAAAGAPAPPDTIIDSLTVHPTLFPVGIKVVARAFGGEIGAQISGWMAGTKGDPGAFTKLDTLTVKNLDLAKAALKPVIGLDLAGVLNVDADFAHMNELSKGTGSFKLSGHDLALVGGEVANYPLPKLTLGTVDIHLKSDTGKATIEKFAIGGGDVEASGEGDVTLDNRLGASHEKIRLEFKPSEGWLANKNNDMVKMGLSVAGHPDSKGFYTVNLEGMLGNPTPKMK